LELDKLYNAILNQDVEGAVKIAEACLKAGIEPLRALDHASEAIRQVGDLYGRSEIFLPQVVLSAEAIKKVADVLLKKVPRKKRGEKAKFIIGTVEGDIHDIGKSIVATMLEAQGFDVIDLGRDVAAEKFVEAVKKHKPAFVGCSALMTTTAIAQREVIDALKEAGVRDDVKVMVGGGATTELHAKEIGADEWGADAMDAVVKAKRLLASRTCLLKK
jgi:trimethylamine corrinoid protein